MRKSFLLLAGVLLLFSPVHLASQDAEIANRFRDHVRVLASDSLQGRGLGTDGAERTRDYVSDAFLQAGLKSFDSWEDGFIQPFSFRQRLAWIPGYNIAGYIEGSDPELKNEFIVLGAHYDHLGYEKHNGEKKIFPGADDNASGVAAIIELGRYFANNTHLLGRSLIIVAFDAEESGLLGSRHFVENPPVPMEQISLMFSFDMVGMYSSNNGLHLRGMGSVGNGVELAERISAGRNIQLRNTGPNIERRTDTAPFGNAGIPAVHVFTGTKSPYHKPEDQYHLLDYDGMELIHNYMATFISELSKRNQIKPAPSLVAHAEAVDRGSSVKRVFTGFMINTGSGFHRYEDEFFRANSVFTMSTGLFVQIPLTSSFTLQQELLYDFNGSKIEGGDLRRHSLTLPFNVQFGTARIPDNPVRFYSFAGPYYRYSFGGSAAGINLDFQEYSQQEWGYSVGFAIEVFRFSMGYTYRRALTGLFLEDKLPRILDSNNYFSLGYRF